MKKSLWILVLAAVLAACTPAKQGVRTSKQQVVQDIDRARALYEMGEMDAAIASLTQVVDARSYNQGQDLAYELIVEWLLQTNNYAEAKRYASYFLQHHPKSPSAKKVAALFNSTAIHEKLGEQGPQPQSEEPVLDAEIDLDLEKKKDNSTNNPLKPSTTNP